MSLLYYTLVPLYRIFGCLFFCHIYLKIIEGDDDPCHVCQCALALILAIFRRNYEEILHVMLYIGVPQTIFECSRQTSE